MNFNSSFQTQLKRTLLHTAIEAANAAAKVLLTYSEKHLVHRIPSREKFQAGLVTAADEGAQKAAINVLERFPVPMGYVAEESDVLASHLASRKGASGRWIIDPLDGTTNFVHGVPLYCVSIGAEWEGELMAGVILLPALGELYYATLGGGAWARLERKTVRSSNRLTRHIPLRVSSTKTLQESLLTTGFSTRIESIERELQIFHELTLTTRAVRRPGSAAIDLAWTARGLFDGFWERNLNPWDIAAGTLLVREAGGKVTDFEGSPLKVDDRTLLASNSHLHTALMKFTTGENKNLKYT